MLLVHLFLSFLMIGFVSFGGGYAMIPLIQEEIVNRHQWMNMAEFSDVIAVAGMAPGPIATNSAVYVGYHQFGVMGAVVATIGVTLPSLIIILGLGAVFLRYHNHALVKSAFYGLRPVVTGLIIYAAIVFALQIEYISSLSWHTLSLLFIYVLSLVALIRFRIHPLYVILLSGLAGMALYS